ncbi:hypothetical protein FGB62_53g010 [Gracilaria domingensis]|nr:hypothetical protein FGB62_53g010 [Gracilaria domingensis]
MSINSSVIDNEFFECDVPFKLRRSVFSNPIEVISGKRSLLRPQFFPDACVRYMVTFLAQYGRRWLEDSKRLVRIWEKDKEQNGVVKSELLLRALTMISTHTPNDLLQSGEGKQSANWSSTWSTILWSREMGRAYPVGRGIQIPFGERSRIPDEPFMLSFERYESKINFLIDSLPPRLFEMKRHEFQIIKDIRPNDLENFLLFLQSKPVAPLGTVKPKKDARIVADGTDRNGDTNNRSRTACALRSEPKWEILQMKLCICKEAIERAVPGKCIQTWTEKRNMEFVLYLENLFANAWDEYLEDLRLNSSFKKYLTMGDCTPHCPSQNYYWNLWNLPSRAPPALGDSQFEIRAGIKFIGYITERVRNCLAEWTENRDVRELEGTCWTPDIALMPRRSVNFRARSNFSMFFEHSGGTSSRQIFIEPIFRPEGKRITERGKALLHRVLWEGQTHLLEKIDQNVYGPGSIELIFLFLLGFPSLKPQILPLEDKVWFHPEAPVRSPYVYFSLTQHVADHADIEMSLVDGAFSSEFECGSLKFCWEEWIHAFDGAMKVLSLDFVNVDSTTSAGRDADVEVGDTERPAITEDTEEGVHEDEQEGNSRNTVRDRQQDGESSEDARYWIRRCDCKHPLHTKAWRHFDENEDYCWRWEGWKAQKVFQEQPIFFKVRETEGRVVVSDAYGGDSVLVSFPVDESNEAEDRGNADGNGGDERHRVEVTDDVSSLEGEQGSGHALTRLDY